MNDFEPEHSVCLYATLVVILCLYAFIVIHL